MINKLEAYKVITESNYEIIKDVFLETVEHDWKKEKVISELVSRANLKPEEASALYEAEFDGSAVGK